MTPTARRTVPFRPEDEPLRDDVLRLGALVGRVIREQAGVELYECVERVRQEAIRRREGAGRGAR